MKYNYKIVIIVFVICFFSTILKSFAYDSLIIKFNSDGKLEWRKQLYGAQSKLDLQIWLDDVFIYFAGTNYLTALSTNGRDVWREKSHGFWNANMDTKSNFLYISYDDIMDYCEKRDKTGDFIWKKGLGEDYFILDLTIDIDDQIYLLLINAENSNYSSYILCKLDERGSVQWEKIFLEGNYLDVGIENVYPNPDGGAIITGFENGQGIIFYIDGEGDKVKVVLETGFPDFIDEDGFIYLLTGSQKKKFDMSGNLIWETTKTQSINDILVSVDKSNNIILSGWYKISHDDNYNRACRIIKISYDGEVMWQKMYQFKNKSSFPLSMKVDNLNNVIISGNTIHTDGETIDDRQFFTVKLDSDGKYLWSNSDVNGAEAFATTVDDEDNVYVAGSWREQEDAGCGCGGF